MAEWFADGLLERLTDKHDAIARHLLRDACVYVMPNVNPDGTWRGHLRTNAAGESSKSRTCSFSHGCRAAAGSISVCLAETDLHVTRGACD
jgi:hypothetical protein